MVVAAWCSFGVIGFSATGSPDAPTSRRGSFKADLSATETFGILIQDKGEDFLIVSYQNYQKVPLLLGSDRILITCLTTQTPQYSSTGRILE